MRLGSSGESRRGTGECGREPKRGACDLRREKRCTARTTAGANRRIPSLGARKRQARSNGSASYRELPVSCREASFYRGGQLSPTDQPPGRGRPSITAAPSDRQANGISLEPAPRREQPGLRSWGAPLRRGHNAPSHLRSQRKHPERRTQRIGGSEPAP